MSIIEESSNSKPDIKTRRTVGWYTDAAHDSTNGKPVVAACQQAGLTLVRLGSPLDLRSYTHELGQLSKRQIDIILLDAWSSNRCEYYKTYGYLGPNQYAHQIMQDLAIDAIILGPEDCSSFEESDRRNDLPPHSLRRYTENDKKWSSELATLLQYGTEYYREGLANDLLSIATKRLQIFHQHLENLNVIKPPTS